MRMLRAEFQKLLTLPGIWAGMAATVLGTTAIALLNATSGKNALDAGEPERYLTESIFDAAYAGAPLGAVGAIVIGVLAIGSEYTANSPDAGGGRQISATLAAMPSRIRLMLTKAVAVLILSLATAAIAFPANIGVSALILGKDLPLFTTSFPEQGVPAILGATLYWTLMGLIALGITAMVRTVTIPLLILIVNGSAVSISFLLTNVTKLAWWLPDAAGYQLYHGLTMVEGGLDARTGALVMAAWAVVIVAAGTAVFTRRDA